MRQIKAQRKVVDQPLAKRTRKIAAGTKRLTEDEADLLHYSKHKDETRHSLEDVLTEAGLAKMER